MRLLFISWILSWLPVLTVAQRVQVTGQVRDASSQRALPGVVVQSQSANETTYTNEQGLFSMVLPANRPLTLGFSLLGKMPVSITFRPSRDTTLAVLLDERSFGLDEVTVVAKEQRIGSSSVIDKSALVHVQPVSLADVLQLVPGQLATNPNLSGPQQVTLRQVPTGADATRANALGTALIQDGVPVSNNANLQSVQNILNTTPGALPPFASTVGRGNDLRQFGADNLETVEVIRGIPSAKYGDLTSGMIITTSRIGQVRPELRVRLNPNLLQGAWMSGFRLNSRQTLTASLDFVRAQDDPRIRLNTFSRLNGQLAWQRQTPQLTTTAIVQGYRTLDDQRNDPSGGVRMQRLQSARDVGGKASLETRWRPRQPWLNGLRAIAALTYADQRAFTQELLVRDLVPLSLALTDTTKRGIYGEAEYLSQLTVSGRPLNGYANAEANWLLRSGRATTHAVLAGMEWRMDVNFGDGRVFDPLRPPRQNYSVGERPRPYRAIPALHQVSYYVEDKLTGWLGTRSYTIQAGVRIDNLFTGGPAGRRVDVVTSPRLNVALETLPGLYLRAGVGRAAKAPTLDVLYPGPRFFDLVNVNYFAQNPAERLLLITTRVINLDGQRIGAYRADKLEVGFDGTLGRFTGAITAFRETTTGAFGTNRIAVPFALARYGIVATPPGQPPVLTEQPTRFDTVFVAYDRPAANRRFMNRGVEWSVLTPEWPALRTSFQLNGFFYYSNSFDDGTVMDADRAITGTTVPRRVAIYQSGANRTATQLSTSLRFIHRLPALRLVVSALWQTLWQNSNQSEPLNPNPVGFVTRQGNVVALSPAQSQSPEFADLRRVIDARQEILFDPPPLHLFNVRVTKEWAKGYGFSFYANNVPGSRPLAFNPQSQTQVRRGEALFFGAEINLSF